MSVTTKPPLTPRLEVKPLDQWGKLVKSWATQQDYVNQAYVDQPPRNYSVKGYPIPPPPIASQTDIDANGASKLWALPPLSSVMVPGTGTTGAALLAAVALTVQEFRNRVEAAGVIVTNMPAQYQNVIVVQGNENTMVIRLPPRDILQGSEDDLINKALKYPFNDFYTDYYKYNESTKTVGPVPPDTRAEIMELHANRIGEYTLNSCN